MSDSDMVIPMAAADAAFEPAVPASSHRRYIQWSPVILGAIASAALSFILISFGAAIGLGISSTSPSWRDASAALALLSGIYLILQALVSFGFGGYITGRTMTPHTTSVGDDDRERRDGLHGLASWAIAVLIGAFVLAMFASAALERSSIGAGARNASTSSAEPLLSYELDRLFRASRRNPTTDMREPRAEAGRILLTSSSHEGVTTDDRAYLVQLVSGTTGLAAPDSERRVDTAIANARTAIARSRRSGIIVAFSIAAATLIGAGAAWAAACAGGRHRDGAPLPSWMERSNLFYRRRRPVQFP